MTNSNIDKFDEITGRLFADLYASFPVPIVIKSENYSAHVEQSDNIGTNLAREANEHNFVDCSVKWLKASGFITYSTRSNSGFHEAVLTSKGLQSLKLVPTSLQAAAGVELADAIKSGKNEIVKSITNQVIGAGVSFALKQIGIS